MKKAKKGYEVNKKKAEKAAEKESKDAEDRVKRAEEEAKKIEEAKSVKLVEDPSLPKAKKVDNIHVYSLIVNKMRY